MLWREYKSTPQLPQLFKEVVAWFSIVAAQLFFQSFQSDELQEGVKRIGRRLALRPMGHRIHPRTHAHTQTHTHTHTHVEGDRERQHGNHSHSQRHSSQPSDTSRRQLNINVNKTWSK